MRILGIDYGGVRIGLAISDETGTLARPLQIVLHSARQADAESIARIAAEKEARLIVVGLPTDAEGDIGPQARKVKRWAEALSKTTAIPIAYWDETFSSQEAEALQPRRKRGQPQDARAAAVILQGYLDAHRPAPDNSTDIPTPPADTPTH